MIQFIALFAFFIWGPIIASVVTLIAWMFLRFGPKPRRKDGGELAVTLSQFFLWAYVVAVIGLMVFAYATGADHARP
jgi:amino acid permease